jgi:hypothetical protein
MLAAVSVSLDLAPLNGPDEIEVSEWLWPRKPRIFVSRDTADLKLLPTE